MLFILTLGKTQSKSFTRASQMLGKRARQYPEDLEAAIAQVEVIAGIQLATEYMRLEKKYPDAKFLLLTRKENEWLDSFAKHCERVKKSPKIAEMKKLRKEVFGAEEFDRSTWRKKKRQFEREVKEFFSDKSEKFAELDPFTADEDAKWQVLIDLLDPKLKRPQFEAFPNVN